MRQTTASWKIRVYVNIFAIHSLSYHSVISYHTLTDYNLILITYKLLQIFSYAKKYSGKIFGMTREAEVGVENYKTLATLILSYHQSKNPILSLFLCNPELVSRSLEKTRGTGKRFQNKFGMTGTETIPKIYLVILSLF